MNLRIRTFSMALVAMSAASQVYALPSDDSENKEKKEERNVMLNAYTSDIIDVGIQNNGVEHVVPESLTEDEFEMAQFIMTEDECKTWESLYT